MTSTTPITASAHHGASTLGCDEPVSRPIARQMITRLANTRIAPSASAERCSALPWPY